MMTRLIKNWYFISVFMAGLFALVLGIGELELVSKNDFSQYYFYLSSLF